MFFVLKKTTSNTAMYSGVSAGEVLHRCLEVTNGPYRCFDNDISCYRIDVKIFFLPQFFKIIQTKLYLQTKHHRPLNKEVAIVYLLEAMLSSNFFLKFFIYSRSRCSFCFILFFVLVFIIQLVLWRLFIEIGAIGNTCLKQNSQIS